MIIEIRGTGFHNRGAELMLRAVVDHARNFDGQVLLASEPCGTYLARAELKLLQKTLRFRFRRAGVATLLMSKSFRRTYGMVRETEIDAVLDASGFAYTDQWGPESCKSLLRDVQRWRTQGKKVVLLPQAFGPFSGSNNREAFRRAVDEIDLLYARDRQSLQYVHEIVGECPSIRLAPDFTNLLPGAVPRNFQFEGPYACIVPNVRMIDKASSEDAVRYMGLLRTCVTECILAGLEPLLLLFATKADSTVATELENGTGTVLRRVTDCNAAELKGILGQSSMVVASRFHAIVCALSQGVPCIGTGWSHKYEELFREYHCSELLLRTDSGQDVIREQIGRIVDRHERGQLVAVLKDAAEDQKQAARLMWNEVDRLLGLEA